MTMELQKILNSLTNQNERQELKNKIIFNNIYSHNNMFIVQASNLKTLHF